MSNYLDAVKARFAELDLAPPNKLRPCTLAEIEALEQRLPQPLPAAYREFLLWMGHAGGGVMSGSDAWYEDLDQLQEAARDLVANNLINQLLPEQAFAFWMEQGEVLYFFLLDAGDDPPVYMYVEAQSEPTFLLTSASYSLFLLDIVDQHAGWQAKREVQSRAAASTDASFAQSTVSFTPALINTLLGNLDLFLGTTQATTLRGLIQQDLASFNLAAVWRAHLLLRWLALEPAPLAPHETAQLSVAQHESWMLESAADALPQGRLVRSLGVLATLTDHATAHMILEHALNTTLRIAQLGLQTYLLRTLVAISLTRELLSLAAHIALHIPDLVERSTTLRSVAAAQHAAGDPASAVQTLAATEHVVQSLVTTHQQEMAHHAAMRAEAERLIQTGNLQTAQDLLHSIPPASAYAVQIVREANAVTEALIALEHWEAAIRVIWLNPHPYDQVMMLAMLATAVGQCNNPTLATHLLKQAEDVGIALVPINVRPLALVAIVQALASLNIAAEAERVSRLIRDSMHQAVGLAATASAYWHSGDQASATALLAEAEHSVLDAEAYVQDTVFRALVQSWIDTGLFAEAERIARLIHRREDRASALEHVAMASNEASNQRAVQALAAEAKTLQDHIRADMKANIERLILQSDAQHNTSDAEAANKDPYAHWKIDPTKLAPTSFQRVQIIMRAFIARNAWFEAEEAARAIPDAWLQEIAFGEIMGALAQRKAWTQALRLAQEIKYPSHRFNALLSLAAVYDRDHASALDLLGELLAIGHSLYGSSHYGARPLASVGEFAATLPPSAALQRLVQTAWQEASSYQELLSLIALAGPFMHTDPDLGPALFASFRSVDEWIEQINS